MVLLSKCKPEPAPCIEFEAKIYILSSNHKSMSPGYQPVIHIGNVCQPATLVHIDKVRPILELKNNYFRVVS